MSDEPIGLSGDDEPLNIELETEGPTELSLMAGFDEGAELQVDECFEINLITCPDMEEIDLFLLGTPFQGPSAYDVAVKNGFVGTEAEWLASLVGPESPNAAAAYAAQLAAEAARDAALAAMLNANASATSAAGSAAAAVQSVASASAYADEAMQWAQASLSQKVLAETAAASALGYSITASNAMQTATMAAANASQIEGVVTQLEHAAFGSATAAAESSQTASVYADQAGIRATAAQAAQILTEAYRTEAGTYAAAGLVSRNEAESFASDAAASATASQTSRLQAEAALQDTNQIALAVSESSTTVEAWVNQAQEYAEVSQTQSNLAQTSASSASISAQNASISETNADGSAASAAASSALAAQAALDAGNSAEAAVESSQSAQASATAAGNSASAAQTSSVSAASSYAAAGVAVSNAFPEVISGEWFTGSLAGAPNVVANAPTAGQGLIDAGVWTSAVGVNTVAAYKAVVPWSVGKIYELQAEVEAVSAFNGTVTTSLSARSLDAAYANTNTTSFPTSLSVGTRTILTRRFGLGVLPINGTQILDPNTNTAFVRFNILLNNGTAPNRQTKLYRVSLRDMSAVTQAEAQATAAATSASNASTSANAAGESATAASNSATAANTSAGNASTSASQASSSATTASDQAGIAAGHASSASTSATAAANSALAAGNSATAASTSATNAGTSATNAGNSATAAANSAVSAASSYTTARDAAATTFPSTFVNNGEAFTNTAGGDPATRPSATPIIQVAGFGPVNQLTPGGSIASTRSVMPAVNGRVVEVTAEVSLAIHNPGENIIARTVLYSLDGAYGATIGSAIGPVISLPTVDQVVTFSRRYSNVAPVTNGQAWNGSPTWLRAAVICQGGTAASKVNVRKLFFRDITEQVLAEGQATIATNQATAAATNASNASTSATNAGNSATAAAASAVSASSAYTSTRLSAAATLPSSFARDGETWTEGYAGSPETRIPLVAGPIYSFITAGGVGRILQVANPVGSALTDTCPIGVWKVTPGRRYRCSVRARRLTAANPTITVFAIGLDTAYNICASPGYAGNGFAIPAQDTWVESFIDITAADIIAGGGAWLRPMIRVPQLAGSTSVIQIEYIKLEDITESYTAAGHATAAATSASNANTSATNAGNSATAAATSAVNASSSYTDSRNVVRDTVPSVFTSNDLFWRRIYSGAPNDSGSGLQNVTYPVIANIGKVVQTNAGMGMDICCEAAVPLVPGRRLKTTARWRQTAGALTAINIYTINLTDAYALGTGYDTGTQPPTVLGTWYTLTREINTDTLIAGGGVYWRNIWRCQAVTGAIYQLQFLKTEDITESYNANGAATAAAGSASSASTSATNAGQSATAANTSATNAGTSASNASTSATNASTAATSAAGSSAAASASAAIAASVGAGALNKNAGFDNYTTTPGLPNDWQAWSGGNYFTRVDDLAGGFAVQMAAPAGQPAGILQYSSPGTIAPNSYYVMEAEASLNSGTWTGAGVYGVVNNAADSNIYQAYQIAFATIADSSGIVSSTKVGRRTWTRLFQTTADTNASKLLHYAMAHWADHGSVAVANNITFYKLLFRPATAEEVAAGVVLPALSATVTTVQSVAIDAQNKVNAKYGVTLNANGKISGFSNVNNGVTSTFDVQADVFRLSNGTTNATPFSVDAGTGVVYAQGMVIRSGATGARLVITNNLIQVYDANNVLRVRMGIW